MSTGGANIFHYAQGWIQKIQKEGAESPTLPPTEKTSLSPDCLIITTLEKPLEGLGLYKKVLKIQEKWGHSPLRPSLKSAYDASRFRMCFVHTWTTSCVQKGCTLSSFLCYHESQRKLTDCLFFSPDRTGTSVWIHRRLWTHCSCHKNPSSSGTWRTTQPEPFKVHPVHLQQGNLGECRRQSW